MSFLNYYSLIEYILEQGNILRKQRESWLLTHSSENKNL